MTTPRGWQRSRRRRPLACVVLIAALVSACAGSDATANDPGVTGQQTLPQIGPRAIDIDRGMIMVIDSIDASNDDIRVRIRVANLSDQPLDIGADDTFYGPLLTIRDDLDNTYPSLAVEPAGIYSHSVGHFDLRLTGPFDPAAAEFTAELSTQRGSLTTDPIATLGSETVRWWSETPVASFDDLTVQDANRSVRVVDIVDRGTHLDVSIEASDTSTEFSSPDAERATLTLSDGTRLESLPPAPIEIQQADARTAVLRFPGTLVTESEPLVLNVAGIDVELPATQWRTTDSPFADLAQLPDLVHAKIFNVPLPMSTVGFGDE